MKRLVPLPIDNFIAIPVEMIFALTLSQEDLDNLVTDIVNKGIGDWAVMHSKLSLAGDSLKFTLPLEVIDISTNKAYKVTKAKILRAIREGLIDFPYALDTVAGYNLSVHSLKSEDLDEIIQLAVFKKLVYKFQ